VRIDQESSSSSNRDAEASTSSSMKPVKTEKAGADLLPKEMNGMTISDDKVDGHNDKVSISFTHSLLTS
jgi:kinase